MASIASAVNIKLLEEFLLSAIHAKGKEPVHHFFVMLRKNPVESTMTMLHKMAAPITQGDAPEAWAAINGVLLGISLAHISNNSNLVSFVEGYLEEKRKAAGGNVVDFAVKKAGRPV